MALLAKLHNMTHGRDLFNLFGSNRIALTYTKVVGKIMEQNFNVLMFSNPGEKILFLVERRGLMCTIVFHLLRTLSPGLENNYTLKCWSKFFPTTLIDIVMFEKCRNNSLVYGILQSRVHKFYEARSATYHNCRSNGHFAEWVNFAYWGSCMGNGLSLQPAQQACFYFYLFLNVLDRQLINK